MQKRAEKIALSAIGGSVCLIFVILAYYIKNISISLNVLASMGLMLPMSKQYYKESLYAYLAVCILGAFFVNINILAFVFLGGLFPLAAIYFFHKDIPPQKRYIAYLIFAIVTFFIYYTVFKAMFLELLATIKMAKRFWLYPLANILYFAALLLYEYILLMVYGEVVKLLKRIRR